MSLSLGGKAQKIDGKNLWVKTQHPVKWYFIKFFFLGQVSEFSILKVATETLLATIDTESYIFKLLNKVTLPVGKRAANILPSGSEQRGVLVPKAQSLLKCIL